MVRVTATEMVGGDVDREPSVVEGELTITHIDSLDYDQYVVQTDEGQVVVIEPGTQVEVEA